MRFTRRAVALGLVSVAAVAVAAPPLTGSRRPAVPTRGFALPGWLSATPRPPSDAMLAELRGLGFQTIRLPVDPDEVTPPVLPAFASVLAKVTGLGFNAIVDLHPGRADIEPERLETAWRLLAPLIADTPPAQVFPELLNEPPFDPGSWYPLRDRLAATVRASAPQHTLIWGPGQYQGIWELAGAPPLPGGNDIAAVHYYGPMAFTHQCADWTDSPLARVGNLPFPAQIDSPTVQHVLDTLDAGDRDWLGRELAEPWSLRRIADEFADAVEWSRRTGTPLQLGEFGVLDFCVDPDSRQLWVSAVREIAESNNIGWIYWEADAGFGFIGDRAGPVDAIDPAMLEALLA